MISPACLEVEKLLVSGKVTMHCPIRRCDSLSDKAAKIHVGKEEG